MTPARFFIAPPQRPSRWHCAPQACTAALAVLLALSGCGSKPPAPQWQVRSLASLEVAESAYLSGQTRVATLELNKARQEISRTADPHELARLELRQCALQVASLDWQDCRAFAPLAAAADAPARAYHAYLQGGMLSPAERALLPENQQRAASLQRVDATSLAALRAIEEPLSRLLATALLMRRAATETPELLALAIDTAASQGWRQPLLAWLLRQQQHAQAQQLPELLEQTALRIRILEQQGAPSATSP